MAVSRNGASSNASHPGLPVTRLALPLIPDMLCLQSRLAESGLPVPASRRLCQPVRTTAPCTSCGTHMTVASGVPFTILERPTAEIPVPTIGHIPRPCPGGQCPISASSPGREIDRYERRSASHGWQRNQNPMQCPALQVDASPRDSRTALKVPARTAILSRSLPPREVYPHAYGKDAQ